MTMADRIAIMNHGELQQVATPLEAYHNPSNEFVAGFIGSPSMNFITVSTEWEGDRLILEHPEFRYQASPSIAEAIGRSHSEVVLGIRPEDIEIVGDPDKNGVVVDLNVIEPLGNEQLLHFELGDSTYTANVSGEYPLSENQRVSVGFPADKVHLFDSDTGDALKNREVSEKPLDNEITTKFADSESAKS
jgi:multiple sugar transport system ATP-binding protein